MFAGAIVALPPSPAPYANATVDGAIAGNVTISGAGAALDGCVTLYSTAWGYVASGCVDGAGHYSIPAVPAGQYYVHFTGFTGGATVYYNGVEASDNATTVTISSGVTATLNYVLAKASVLSGNLTVTGGAAALGGWVYAYDSAGNFASSASVDGAGHFAFTHLLGGSYLIGFTDFSNAANEYYNGHAIWADSDLFAVAPGGTTTLNHTLALAATISGTVLMDASGPAVGGCVAAYDSVTLDYLQGNCTISGSGGYSINGLRPGTYVVEFYSFDGAVDEWYNNKTSSETADDVVVAEGATVVINASLATAGSITGSVSIDGGAPAYNGCIALYNDSDIYVTGRCTGGSTNTFLLDGLAPGTYHLDAYGYDSATNEWYNNAANLASASDIIVVGGSATVVNVFLAPGPGYGGSGAASGRAIVPATLPYANVTITLNTGNGYFIDAVAPNGSGDWGFSGLNDGAYSYCVDYPNGSIDCVPFTITGGANVTGLDSDYSTFQWVRFSATMRAASSQFCPTFIPITGAYTGSWDCAGTTSGTTVSANYLVAPGTYNLYAYDYTPSTGSTDYIWWKSGSPANPFKSQASTYTAVASPSSGTVAAFNFTGMPDLGYGTSTIGLAPSTPVYAGESVTLAATVGGSSGAGQGIVEFYDDSDFIADRSLVAGAANAPYVFDGSYPTSTLSVFHRGDANYGSHWSDFHPAYLPTVTTVTPGYGGTAGGDVVGIEGTALGTVTGVTFDGVPATSFSLMNDWYMEATTPPGTSLTAEVVVTNAVGASPSEVSGSFAYTDGSVVAGIPSVIADVSGFTPNVVRCYQVTGNAGVPIGATGVILNVTASLPNAVGHVRVYPDYMNDGASPAPEVSTVNFEVNRDVANSTTISLPSGGKVCAYGVGGTLSRLILDVDGYILPGSGITLVTPEKLIDTRPQAWYHVGAINGPVQPMTDYSVQVGGVGSVPSDAVAVIANITVVDTTSPGHLRMWASDQTMPNTSVVNYAPETKANSQIVALGADGKLKFRSFSYVPTSVSPVQVLIDVTGYIAAGSAFVPTVPTKLVETRPAYGVVGPISGPLSPGVVYPVPVDTSVVPAGATAVVLNVTAVQPTNFGHIRVYPDTNGLGTTPPPVMSNLNFIPGRDIPNMVIVQLPADRKIDLYTAYAGTGHTDLVINIIGYIAAPI